MSHRPPSDFSIRSSLSTPSIPTLTPDDSASQTTPQNGEQDTPPTPPNTAATTNNPPTKHPIGPLTNDTPTPLEIAIKRTKTAKERFATAHEGWTLVAQALVRSGTIPADEAIAGEMKEFGDAICGRYAAASLLWRVMEDMAAGDWFGPGEKWDGTWRRLKTLKGLEASLVYWEKIVLELVELVDGGGGGGDGRGEEGVSSGEQEEEVRERVRKVLGRWKRAVPSKP